MDVIDGEWIRKRLPEKRGEKVRLARHMGIEPEKLTRILNGERQVQASEIPKVLDFFKEEQPSPPTDRRVVRVPIYDVRASAGKGLIPDGYVAILEEIEIEERYLREVLKVRPENAIIITVDGDSMEPTFRNNDVVIIDVSKNNFSVDGLYVLNFDGTLLVKRLSRTITADHLLLISDNKDKYPAHELPVERLTLIGRVAGALVKL
jgi:phage repressor protein C with HTH and peptisase S24 domain